MTIQKFPLNISGLLKGGLSNDTIRQQLKLAGANGLLEMGSASLQRMVVHMDPHMRLDGDAFPQQLFHNEHYIRQTHSLHTHHMTSSVVAPWLYFLDLLYELQHRLENLDAGTSERYLFVRTIYRSWIYVGFVPEKELAMHSIYREIFMTLNLWANEIPYLSAFMRLFRVVTPHYFTVGNYGTLESALVDAVNLLDSWRRTGDIFSRESSVDYGSLRYIYSVLEGKYFSYKRDEICALARFHLLNVLSGE